MGLGKIGLAFAAIFVLASVMIVIGPVDHVDGYGYDPEIVVGFDEYWMDQELAPDYIVSTPLPIHWYARYNDGTDLTIDLFIRPASGGNWIVIVEGYQNTGTYDWDLVDPTLPDGDYVLKIIAWNNEESYSFAESQFPLQVYNKKAPVVTILTEPDGLEISGDFELLWDVQDEDTSRYFITADVFISSDNGASFSHLTGFYEDPGKSTIDTSIFPNGNDFRFRINVVDIDGLKDTDTSGRFFFFNNAPPRVEITSPKPERGLNNIFKIKWNSSDVDESSDNLLVNLWYHTTHDNAKIDLLRNAQNHGYYMWDTSESKPGPQGHLICVELIDSRGLSSEVDEVKIWILKPEDKILRDVIYPRQEVRDKVSVSWTTYQPAINVSASLDLWIYHKAPGSEMSLISVGEPDLGSYSLDVSGGPDGFHSLKIVIMDSFQSWIKDEIEFQFEVYHEIEPEMYIRKHPPNGSNTWGSMEFDVAGFDGNGDRLTYMGLYGVEGGGWQVFDMAHGNYRQILVWNTTDIPPGEYHVRIAVYDSSRYNLSISETCGPYIVEDHSSPPYHQPLDNGSENSIPIMLKAIIVLLFILAIIVGTLGFVIRKERKKVDSRDMDALRMNPDYVKTYLASENRGGLMERLLPKIGGSSGEKILKEDPNRSFGMDEEETARMQGYLDMLDPDLMDDVSMSDINSYDSSLRVYK
jgi:hypothetical protein